MKIAVLSGKGGTGKTTVSTNLAVNTKNSVLIDADVEEPNAHLFFSKNNSKEKLVYKEYPVVDAEKCTLCGMCGEFCRYNAIIPAKNSVVVFNESCHDCGGCAIVCPVDAITYEKREIGKIVDSESNDKLHFLYGDLNIGEMSGVKIIKELKEYSFNEKYKIIDCPPGTSCATVEAVEGVDFAVIVTEPTPFGVSDMKMVVRMLREMKIPFGVVVNKSGIGDDEIYRYCEENNIEILEEIPFDQEIAKFYSGGHIFSDKIPKYKKIFTDLMDKILVKESVAIEN
jgi:MinD superfamily P-loop ATPase